MHGPFPPGNAAAAANPDPFLTADGARLRPGDRFPNFLLPDQTGGARWFVQRALGRGLLVLLDPDDAVMQSLAAMAADCAAIELDHVGLARVASGDPAFPILIDSANKIGPALRRMSGLAPSGPAAFLLDRNQRVLALCDAGAVPAHDLPHWGLENWRRMKGADQPVQIGQVAPVLTVPGVLDADHCRALIERWHTHGHEAGHVTSLVQGEQIRRVYEDLKRRTDHRLSDPAIRTPLLNLIARRLGPELEKAFQYRGFRFDRVLIACYDAGRGDYFRRHRDNQTPQTEGRRFALTINLNTEDYEGGELVFPEYGAQRFKVPTGGAILFSCSLLHEALPVTRGRRFALLSFLRDAGSAAERDLGEQS